MTADQPSAQSSSQVREILLRDKYHCTATVEPREVRPGFWLPKETRRCTVVGSEMVVRDGRAMCPRHAREWGGAS